MAQTFDSARLRHQRTLDRRLRAEHASMARAVALTVLRFARRRNEAGEPQVEQSRTVRTQLSAAIWSEVLKPFYIGPGDDPFRDATPQSPYARLLFDGVQGAIRIQADRQAALLNRLIRDQAVLGWLTGPRPIAFVREMGTYDPFHTWVDPNGYRLSDRVWRVGIDVRSRIDALLDYHIAQGTSAVGIADLLEPFLTTGGALARTSRPYGRVGSFAARRLARTEITAAAGRATVNASIANPFVMGVRWVLSGSHGRGDECDHNARGGPNGDGVYAPEQVPLYPSHPNCLCHLRPVTIGSPSDVVADLRAQIQAQTSRARALQGLFNPSFLTQAILLGFLDEAMERLEPEEA